MKYYTGVGSRETPMVIQRQINQIAKSLEAQGYILRSGGAEGADTAFENALHNEKAAEIYLPWQGFNDRFGPNAISLNELNRRLVLQAECIAEEIHPAWERLRQGAKKLHTRNAFQVLGKDLNTPSEVLICYARPKGDSVSGGTRTAVELARKHGIPIINIYHEDFA